MKLIKLEKSPNVNISFKVEKYLNPPYIYIPYHKDDLNVKDGDNVYINKRITAKHYSSISGKVLGLNKGKYIVIANDFKEKTNKTAQYNIKTSFKNQTDILLNILNITEKENPHLFSIFKSLKQCQNIVVSAINDEIYVLNNIIMLKKYINQILEMIEQLSLIYKSSNNVIIVKDTENSLIDNCCDALEAYPNLKLSLVADKYLIGQKNILLNTLKFDINKTLFLNVKDIVDLIYLLKNGHSKDTQLITISGDAIKLGKIIEVKKYSRVGDIINQYIKISDNNFWLLKNNILEENIITFDEIITTDLISIHLMKKKLYEEQPCYNCGKCLEVCPMHIDIIKSIKSGQKDPRCINCGLCSYICPAYINLRKYLRGSKK